MVFWKLISKPKCLVEAREFKGPKHKNPKELQKLRSGAIYCLLDAFEREAYSGGGVIGTMAFFFGRSCEIADDIYFMINNVTIINI